VAQIKGTAVQSSLRYVRERGGAPQFCERIYGWMQRTLEMAGARNLRSAHSACVHRGDPACRFEGSWD